MPPQRRKLCARVDGAGTAAPEEEQEDREAAYKPCRHRCRIEEYSQGLLMDYSSFTRLRALRSHGDWDGDPFASTSSKASKETTQ